MFIVFDRNDCLVQSFIIDDEDIAYKLARQICGWVRFYTMKEIADGKCPVL